MYTHVLVTMLLKKGISKTKKQKLALIRSLIKMGEERVLNKVFRRSHFNREVSKGSPVDMDKVKRDYMWHIQEFQETLEQFNRDNSDEHFKCVGYANVRLSFCSYCFDAEKSRGRELYYVNKDQLAQHRQNICHGCLGHKLRRFAEHISFEKICT